MFYPCKDAGKQFAACLLKQGGGCVEPLAASRDCLSLEQGAYLGCSFVLVSAGCLNKP